VTAPAAIVDAVEAEGPSRARTLQRLAAVLAVVGVGEALAILLLGNVGDRRFTIDASLIPFAFLANVVLYPVMGALIVQRRPFTRVAWLLIALGVMLGFGLVTYAYGVVGEPPARELPLALPVLVLSQLFFLPAVGSGTTLILLLYPTDHVLGPRWRVVGALAVIASVVYMVGTLLRPGELDPVALPGLRNPFALDGQVGVLLGAFADAANAVGLVMLILAATSQVLRYRRADPIVAAQIRWLALVAVLDVTAIGLSLLPILPPGIDDLLFGLGLTMLAGIPVAIGIAITRYRLYDIDRLINRALVYGSLTAILAGVFTAGIGLAQRLFVAATGQSSDGAVVAATLVVATLYAPLRKRLEAIVDRWFKYESRRFGAYRAQVEAYLAIAEPREAAVRLANEAYAEFDPTGLAVIDHDGQVVASAGIWPQPIAMRLPIGRGERSIGTLLVGPRRDGRPHDAREVEDLADLAVLVGSAARG